MKDQEIIESMKQTKNQSAAAITSNKKHFFDNEYYQQCMQKYKDKQEQMEYRKQQMERMEIERYTFQP